ncbi:MAG: hypothetical protein ABF289_18215 [Clostridiales bacterium]
MKNIEDHGLKLHPEELNNKFGWSGEYTIIKKNVVTGKIIKVINVKNLITNLGLDEIIKALSSGIDMQLAYLAIGDSSLAEAASQTTLDNEIFRVPILAKTKTGTGQLQSTALLLADEPDYAPYNGVCTVREIGIFCGSAALTWNGGAGKDTGLMISRIVITAEAKVATEEFQFTRTDLFSRV